MAAAIRGAMVGFIVAWFELGVGSSVDGIWKRLLIRWTSGTGIFVKCGCWKRLPVLVLVESRY